MREGRVRGNRDERLWRDEDGDSREYGWYGDSMESAAYGTYDGDSAMWEAQSAPERALVVADSAELPATVAPDGTGPLVVPGSGVSMGSPFIKRRERPLTLRVAVLTLMATILVSGLFTVTPLGNTQQGSLSAFQALSGSVVWQKGPGYVLYSAQSGDTVEGIAARFKVQIGGIYQLNKLMAGQEVAVGQTYKIPTDPNYGKDYRPQSLLVSRSSGATVFGSNWWNSYSGTPPPESPCAPNGNGNPLGYKLRAPNWGASWVRGFSWYHNGLDLAAQYGNPIHAAQSGQVIWAGYDATNGSGWSVKVNNCNHVSTLYFHMAGVNVKAGQFVTVGDVVGFEGSSGWSTGPHLHFGVQWDNVEVDPLRFFPNIDAVLNYRG